ncbi:MAG: electron transfer flavoprotein subunit alpha/FixB family protein [Acidobacteria bacterium]|nr:electron transfer flavoprotein subunit alpha/FixB family protein [Acidobacteriota bacterium]
MAEGVLVFIEHRDGKLKKASLEAASEGRRLADRLSAPLTALILGNNLEPVPEELKKVGVDKVVLGESEALASYSTEGYTFALAKAIDEVSPLIVLLSATAMGKDLAPRVAARLKAGLASDCTKLILADSGELKAVKPLYLGKIIATFGFSSPPYIATLRPKAFEVEMRDGSSEPEVMKLDLAGVEEKIRAKAVDYLVPESGTADITEAEVIVSGGRGLGCADNFNVLKELADLLNGAVGASRAAVDSGWVDHQIQVGQTGKTVSPTLYLACGISGAIQHLAGMSSSRFIAAINKDPDAPIFKVADFGIVGDVLEVVPAIAKELKKVKGA